MRSYIKIASLLPKSELYKLFTLVPLMGIAGILEVASIASLIPLMSIALDPVKVEDLSAIAGLSGINYSEAMLYLVFLVIFCFVLKGAVSLFVYNLSYKFVGNAKKSFQNTLFSCYLNKDFKYHLDNNTGDYLRNLTTECNAIEARFIMPSLVLLAEVIPLFFLVLFLMCLNPYGLILSGALFFLFGTIVAKFNSKRLKQLAKIQISSDGSIVKAIQQTFSSIREILIYERQAIVEKKFEEHCRTSANSIAKGLTYNTIPKLILEIVAILCVFLIATLSYLSGTSIQNILIELGVFLATMIKVLPSASKVIAHVQALSYAKPSINNYLAAINDGDRSEKILQQSIETFHSLELNDVVFSYGGHKILNGITLSINRGDVVGIVGETGSGKSTLLNLILGLMTPSSGEVSVNGLPMDRVRESFWHRVGYVPQETYLIDESIVENISFYRPYFDKQINESVELASLSSTVEKLHEGLMTRVGEGGCNLSGGQRQRIGFARALLNSPEFLVMDEATSALDRNTEDGIIRNLSRISRDKTIIMIAHRESTLSICDYIVEVKNGSVTIQFNRKCQYNEILE